MVMVLSLREPIAVAAWLVQAAGAGALPDTIVTKQVVLSTGPLGVVTAIANVLVCDIIANDATRSSPAHAA